MGTTEGVAEVITKTFRQSQKKSNISSTCFGIAWLRWLQKPTDLRTQEDGYTSANFTNNNLKFGVVLAEGDIRE